MKLSPLLVAPIAPGDTDKGQVVGQPLLPVQVVEGWQQLLDRQVAGGTKNNEVTGTNHGAHFLPSAWPPKPWRILASILAPYSSPPWLA